MNTMTQPCEYELCHCTVTGGTEGAAYCSEECADRDSTELDPGRACECGHPPCDDSD